MEQISGEPAADLRAAEHSGVQLPIRELQERRTLAREIGGSGAGGTEVGIPAIAVEAGSEGDAGEPQASVPGIPGSRTADSAEKKKTLATSGFCATPGERTEPGVGDGFCA